MGINRSRKTTIIIFSGIFILLLLCNSLTKPVADDFAYMYSWETHERITNFSQILPSMIAHSHLMNGRFVTHFLVQLFLMLPKFVFNIANTFVFTLMVFLAYRFSRAERNNNLLALSVFACIWIFTPLFGQVMLWVDGACNYLWSLCLNLIFILPFVELFINGKKIHRGG